MTPDIQDKTLAAVLEEIYVKFYILHDLGSSESQRFMLIWTDGKLKGNVQL